MKNKDFILEIYKDNRTVFRLADIAMLFPFGNNKFLKERVRYYVRTGRLLNPRKGIYAKPNYNPEELACLLYTPSYISMEYVLQKAGVIFQFDSRLTCITYLTREIEIDGNTYSYRRIKEEIIIDSQGINRYQNTNIATPERAFLDMIYLDKDIYFDNINPLDKKLINKLLPIYNSPTMKERTNKILNNDRH